MLPAMGAYTRPPRASRECNDCSATAIGMRRSASCAALETIGAMLSVNCGRARLLLAAAVEEEGRRVAELAHRKVNNKVPLSSGFLPLCNKEMNLGGLIQTCAR